MMRTVILALTLAAAVVSAADAPPRPSPAFSILQIGTKPIELAQYKGKVVALAIISTTCQHCQALTNTLNPIAKDYTPKGVQFVECAFNPTAERDVPVFVQRFQPMFPVCYS